MYDIIYYSQVKKDLKKLDKKLLLEIKEKHIHLLATNPYIGEKLKGKLSGAYSYHFKHAKVEYRIAYIIEEQIHIVQIYKIGKRENFYRDLENRLDES